MNGVPLENVEYARAVQVLRDSGATVSLVVRRRAPAPPPTAPTTIKLSLTRNGKKEGECLFSIPEITGTLDFIFCVRMTGVVQNHVGYVLAPR